MGQALYRKYRSKKLSEIVGQDHITRTLENALKNGKISHAYLFTGPRGVGKTSIARILAHEINQLPYTDESMHLDIIEIDAASNRRIDEIRDLREKVHIAPTSAKYKVYIIDEVHMLTKEAFNALLKTLEEPPAHVVFILATTEIHKLPETIVSRTQRFTFKSIDETAAVDHLKAIAEAEGMQIDEDALHLLATHGGGSFRDSISLLDQVGNSKKSISRKDAEKLVGIASSDHIAGLEQAVTDGSPADIATKLDQLVADGISPAQAAKQLSALLRQKLIKGEGNTALTDLIADLLHIQNSPEPAAQLEVALFKTNLFLNPTAQASQPFAIKQPVEKHTPGETVTKPAQQAVKEKEDKPAATETTTLPGNEPPTVYKTGSPAEWWNDVLVHIKSINNTLYGVLRMAEASLQDDTLQLRFGFGFHKKKADDAANQAKINEAVKAVTGQSYRINAVHDAALGKEPKVKAPSPAANEPAKPADNSELSSITNIFGGGEVLES